MSIEIKALDGTIDAEAQRMLREMGVTAVGTWGRLDVNGNYRCPVRNCWLTATDEGYLPCDVHTAMIPSRLVEVLKSYPRPLAHDDGIESVVLRAMIMREYL